MWRRQHTHRKLLNFLSLVWDFSSSHFFPCSFRTFKPTASVNINYLPLNTTTNFSTLCRCVDASWRYVISLHTDQLGNGISFHFACLPFGISPLQRPVSAFWGISGKQTKEEGILYVRYMFVGVWLIAFLVLRLAAGAERRENRSKIWNSQQGTRSHSSIPASNAHCPL